MPLPRSLATGRVRGDAVLLCTGREGPGFPRRVRSPPCAPRAPYRPGVRGAAALRAEDSGAASGGVETGVRPFGGVLVSQLYVV